MTWRLLLTALYAGALAALMAADNYVNDVPTILAIGWDAGENDGNPALWPPYVLTMIALLGAPLFLGLALSRLWRGSAAGDRRAG